MIAEEEPRQGLVRPTQVAAEYSKQRSSYYCHVVKTAEFRLDIIQWNLFYTLKGCLQAFERPLKIM